MKVFLVCKECQRLGQFNIGTSDLFPLPIKATQGEVIQDGGIYDWVKAHHGEYAGMHNSFDAFNESGNNKIAYIGFGYLTGYTFTFLGRPRR